MFKFGFLKPRSTVNKSKIKHEFNEERKDSTEDGFVNLQERFDFQENTQKIGAKTSFGLAKKKKSERRRKSLETKDQTNEF